MIVTLTTDFGPSSPYVAAMKGVILSIASEVRLVDLSHAVPPQDVAHGAAVLEEVAPFFPTGAIHVAVVDPGVGTDRRIVYAEIGGQRFVAPDNGLLGPLAAESPPTELREITNRDLFLPEISATFHGRDIMAPVAAHLALGVAAEQLGPPLQRLVSLDAPVAVIQSNAIRGTVRMIDSFGNVISNIRGDTLKSMPLDTTATICCGGQTVTGLFSVYADAGDGQLIALIGSAGYVELAVVGGSAAARLGVCPGEPFTIDYTDN
jgi:S-adenosylmethionine hydrolase